MTLQKYAEDNVDCACPKENSNKKNIYAGNRKEIFEISWLYNEDRQFGKFNTYKVYRGLERYEKAVGHLQDKLV